MRTVVGGGCVDIMLDVLVVIWVGSCGGLEERFAVCLLLRKSTVVSLLRCSRRRIAPSRMSRWWFSLQPHVK